ncbi:MAG: hypothetical protein ACRDPT_13085 [Streptomycetales bacterium]
MLHALLFNRVAVVVRHWFEIGLKDGVMEHGARLELRLLAPQAHRGTESAAQRLVIDRPVWRADLFDRLDRPAGTFSAAHYHPTFTGNEPCERVWDPGLKEDPWSWALEQLADIGSLCERNDVSRDAVADDVGDVYDRRAWIVGVARDLAPAACTSVDQCYALTKDVSETVRLMVENMDDVSMLHDKYVAPWMGNVRA